MMSQALLDKNEATQTNEYYQKIRKELEAKKKSMLKSFKTQSTIVFDKIDETTAGGAEKALSEMARDEKQTESAAEVDDESTGASGGDSDSSSDKEKKK